MLEDEILKWKFKGGSSEALARIYEKYVDTLLTLAMGLLNDPHEAEDVVQDVFTRFARSSNGFTLRGNLKAYLTTAVVNGVRDRVRREKRRPVESNQDVSLTSTLRGPDEELVFAENAARLSSVLMELPHEQRETLMLKLKSNMKFKEIAKIQGVSINTVQGRYRYGLKKLRASLNGEVDK